MISVIFPTFNEENNLIELHKRLRGVTAGISGQDFEFLFVDDCSSDGTPRALKQIAETDARVRIIRFARNCGSHAAIAAGLHHSRGDAAIILAADLQDPPQLITTFLNEWERGAKIVWGARKKRQGEAGLVKLFSKFYYKIMNWLTTVKMPPLGADVFLVDRVVIKAFSQMTEKHSSIFMALAWLGFEQKTFYYTKEPRFQGKSKWTVGKKIKLTLDSLLSFSDIPIRYMSALGLLTATVGFMYALYVLWCYVFQGIPVEGWSSLIVAILIIGGVQMVMMGLLGEYLWRTFDESRKRPRYVIEYVNDNERTPVKLGDAGHERGL